MGTVISVAFGSLRPSSRFAGNEGGCFYKTLQVEDASYRLEDNFNSDWQRAQQISIRLDEQGFRLMFEIAAFDGEAVNQFKASRVGMASEPHGCHELRLTPT